MKLGHVPSIVRLTVPTSNTPISAAKQHTASADTELGKKSANDGSVVARDGLLVVSIRGRDCLRNRLLEGDVFEPIEVWFVYIICWIVSEMKLEGLGMAADVLGAELSGTKGGDPPVLEGEGQSEKNHRSRAHTYSKRWELAKTDRRYIECPDLPTQKETAPDM